MKRKRKDSRHVENEKIYTNGASTVELEAAKETNEVQNTVSMALMEATESIPLTDDAPNETDKTPPYIKSSPEIVFPGKDAEQKNRIKLIIMLICTVFAAIAVIVYGVAVADGIARMDTPLPERLLGEVFSAGVTTFGTTYARPPLTRIPPQTVIEGEAPGAAEHETVTEEEPPKLTDTRLPVKSVDLSVSADNVFAIINETPYEPDAVSLYAEESKIPPLSDMIEKYGSDSPVVLILHTHGTESYLPDGAESYDSSESFRSYDTDRNIVTVGRVIAARLREHGIPVLHLETMFDAEDYNSAYYLAASEIKRITEEYPSVAYVFDIHRDAMITSEGVNLKPTSPLEWEGGKAAQIMLVVGTDHAGSGHTEWEDNLSLALKMQKSALTLNGGIMRAVNLRSASFNEQYTKGSLLVEIGAAGSSLTEACRAGEIFAEAAAKVIIGK